MSIASYRILPRCWGAKPKGRPSSELMDGRAHSSPVRNDCNNESLFTSRQRERIQCLDQMALCHLHSSGTVPCLFKGVHQGQPLPTGARLLEKRLVSLSSNEWTLHRKTLPLLKTHEIPTYGTMYQWKHDQEVLQDSLSVFTLTGCLMVSKSCDAFFDTFAQRGWTGRRITSPGDISAVRAHRSPRQVQSGVAARQWHSKILSVLVSLESEFYNPLIYNIT